MILTVFCKDVMYILVVAFFANVKHHFNLQCYIQLNMLEYWQYYLSAEFLQGTQNIVYYCIMAFTTLLLSLVIS